MEDPSEPFDLLTVAFEVADRLNGLVEVRSEKNRTYKLSVRERGGIQDQLHTDYAISLRHRTMSDENFFSTENLRTWSSDLNSFVERVNRKSGLSSQTFEVNHVAQGNLKIGNIQFEELQDEMKQMLQDLIQLAKSNLQDSFDIQIDFEVSSRIKTYTSSLGSHIVQGLSKGILTFHLTNNNPPYNTLNTMIGGVEKESLTWEKMLKTLNTLISEAKDMSRIRSLSPTRSDLVLSNDATWTIFHELIGHAVEKSEVNLSHLAGREGTKVAPSIISIIDDKGIPAVGSYGFDDEGQKASGTVIIEEGILNSHLYDQKTAMKDGVLSTGNARAPSVHQPPLVRQSNLFIEPGDLGNGELFEEVRSGFLVGPSAYAFSEITKGRVTIQPQYLQRIEEGELKEMYLSHPLSWDFNEIIPKIKSVGKSMINRPTYCTKEGDTLGVGMLSPMIVVENVRVGS